MTTPNRIRNCLVVCRNLLLRQLGISQSEPANGTTATESERIKFFESQIRPLLIEHCLECHAADTEASGGLLLDSRPNWERGGDSGDAIVPKDPDASLLLRAVLYDDPDLQMPPDGKLPDASIAALKTWIETGAADPRMEVSVKPSNTKALSVADAQQHWAYRSITKPQGGPPMLQVRLPSISLSMQS